MYTTISSYDDEENEECNFICSVASLLTKELLHHPQPCPQLSHELNSREYHVNYDEGTLHRQIITKKEIEAAYLYTGIHCDLMRTSKGNFIIKYINSPYIFHVNCFEDRLGGVFKIYNKNYNYLETTHSLIECIVSIYLYSFSRVKKKIKQKQKCTSYHKLQHIETYNIICGF